MSIFIFLFIDKLQPLIIGVPKCLQLFNLDLFYRSLKYLTCNMKIPYLFCTIYNPQNYFISPIILILNSFFISSQNFSLDSSLPLIIMSSINTKTIREPLSFFFRYKLLPTLPLQIPNLLSVCPILHTKL